MINFSHCLPSLEFDPANLISEVWNDYHMKVQGICVMNHILAHCINLTCHEVSNIAKSTVDLFPISTVELTNVLHSAGLSHENSQPSYLSAMDWRLLLNFTSDKILHPVLKAQFELLSLKVQWDLLGIQTAQLYNYECHDSLVLMMGEIFIFEFILFFFDFGFCVFFVFFVINQDTLVYLCLRLNIN